MTSPSSPASTDGIDANSAVTEKSATECYGGRNQPADARRSSLTRIESAISAASGHYEVTLSRLRSRRSGQTGPFSHPLSHVQTASDVLVDFDGPDDPYNPLNWSFKKKAITTLLYGLTTMGKSYLDVQLPDSRRLTYSLFLSR
jgi:hypothetical protein